MKPVALAKRVRQARIAKGITQSEAAKLAGVALSTWQSFERDQNPTDPKSSALAVLCGLGVNGHWLLTGAGTMECGEASPGFQPQALIQAIDLVETWLQENGRAMSPAKKAEVIGFAYEILTESNGGNQGTARDNIVRLLKVAS